MPWSLERQWIKCLVDQVLLKLDKANSECPAEHPGESVRDSSTPIVPRVDDVRTDLGACAKLLTEADYLADQIAMPWACRDVALGCLAAYQGSSRHDGGRATRLDGASKPRTTSLGEQLGVFDFSHLSTPFCMC